MDPPRSATHGRILRLLAGLLILRVTVGVVANYGDYVPPSFASDFLRGREHFFLGPYRWAFYAHILSGPVSLMLGLILIPEWPRRRFPDVHRLLGRLQVALVLCLVAPSGLWMAPFAVAGPVAAVGLATLAIATAACAVMGARSAAGRRFGPHRRWMLRCYLLLCSAVVLRLLGGLATVAGITAAWFDPLANWASWLVPLLAFEAYQSSLEKSSPPAIVINARRIFSGIEVLRNRTEPSTKAPFVPPG